MGCCSSTSSAVGVCSTARQKRNQEAKGIRRALWTGTSPRSRAIIPKPLLCSSRSVTFSICASCDSQRWMYGFFQPEKFPPFVPALDAAEGYLRERYFSPQRTQSKRLISMPAAAADAGSNVSLTSTRAQTSPRWVARASAKSSTLVLPDEAVPQISVRQPRARPPVSESSCGIPVGNISGAGRAARREAGTTVASLEMAPTWAKRSTVFLAVFSALDRGEDGVEKIKGRPMAADEKTGEADILFSQLSGNAEGKQPGRRFIFAFYSPLKVSLFNLPLSSGWRKNQRPEVPLKPSPGLASPFSEAAFPGQPTRLGASNLCYNRDSLQAPQVALSSRG